MNKRTYHGWIMVEQEPRVCFSDSIWGTKGWNVLLDVAKNDEDGGGYEPVYLDRLQTLQLAGFLTEAADCWAAERERRTKPDAAPEV